MTSNYRFVICAVAASLGLATMVACSSSGPGGTKNDFCGVNYQDPLRDDKLVVGNGRITLAQGTPFAPPKGSYAYYSASIWYHDNVTGTKLMITETPNTAGQMVITGCGANLRPKMTPFSFSIPYISDIQSDGSSTQIKTKVMSVDVGMPSDLTQHFVRPTFTVDKGSFQGGDPTNTYATSYTTSLQTFDNVGVPNVPVNYALVSYLTNTQGQNNIEVRVSVYMLYTAPTAPPATNNGKK